MSETTGNLSRSEDCQKETNGNFKTKYNLKIAKIIDGLKKVNETNDDKVK